jgi:hypothetical protein
MSFGAKRDYDCELHHWVVNPVPLHPGRYFLFGMTFDDRRGLRTDGKGVRTSYLLTPLDQLRDGAVAQTLNTRYLLCFGGAFGNIH